MSRQETQASMYELEARLIMELAKDPELTPDQKIKLVKEVREGLSDNGTTAAAVPEEIKSVVQTALEDGELEDSWEDPEFDGDEYDTRLRIVNEA